MKKNLFLLLSALILIIPVFVLAKTSKNTYKTYTNTQYGYLFEYPASLKPDVFDNGASVAVMFNPEEVAIPKMTSVQLYVEPNVNRWTFEQLIRNQLDSPKVGALGEYRPKIKTKNITVNKIKSKLMNYKNDLGSETLEIVFLKDNLVWHIQGNISIRNFRRLVKSFKFIPKK